MRLKEIFPDTPYNDADVTRVTVREDVSGEYRSPEEYAIMAYFVNANGEHDSELDWFPVNTIFVAGEQAA